MKNIKELRRDKKISQWFLAHKTGISRYRIQLIEATYAIPTNDELKKINAVLSGNITKIDTKLK
ncbi:MAG: helix-turn-helix transcriptional regulator [Bdellovibrionaceae bacterium]|nr:helix-turn-helix transcriptional regulator [Pseudobdellovibrionaceae bacterium]NUM58141.1 helix-turn-helix transcriptional regulator [Pseudobdellovibrionaceae bacterium]